MKQQQTDIMQIPTIYIPDNVPLAPDYNVDRRCFAPFHTRPRVRQHGHITPVDLLPILLAADENCTCLIPSSSHT
jgi:hypothetical protein